MQLSACFAATLATLASSSFALAAAPTSQADEVVALGKRVMDAANVGDMDKIAGELTDGDHQIVDNFPPFTWGGPNGYTEWLAAYGQELAANKITDTHTKLGKPIYLRIEGDLAYVAIADTYTYTRAAARVRENLIWSYVARRTASGWKLSSFSFAGGPRP